MTSFDQFDLVAYLAPGAIVIIGIALAVGLRKSEYGDATVAVAFTFLAYAVGHIVSALGGVLERVVGRLHGGSYDPEWPLPHIGEDQLKRFEDLVRIRLVRDNPKSLFAFGPQRRGHLYKQLYADVASNQRASRADIYNRLSNFYRGLTAALVVLCVAFLYPLTEHVRSGKNVFALPSLMCVAFAIGTFIQSRGYSNLYDTELLEQFLLLPPVSPDDVPRGANSFIASREVRST